MMFEVVIEITYVFLLKPLGKLFLEIYSSKSPFGGLIIRKLFFISIIGTISFTNGTKTFFSFSNSWITSKLFFSFSRLMTLPITFNSLLSKVYTCKFTSSNK